MPHDFLEDQEERAARKLEEYPFEEGGFVGLANGIRKALAVAGAAHSIAPKTESPIEATLGARLQLMIDAWNKDRKPELALIPQYPLYRFRYDFAITADARLIAVIECDGKDFHSSEAARLNDAAKNVAVWKMGVEIFRFSGSKIFRDDVRCVDQIGAYLDSKYRRVDG